MIQFNCLEPLTNIACGLAFLDGGMSAAVVGSASLLTRFRENSAKHGLDDGSRLMPKVQAAIFRARDRFDTSQADRDALTEADKAMTRLLPQVMLSRDELADTSVSLELYPRHAARLVADRLAAHDPSFAAPADPAAPASVARAFALEVIEAALGAAMNDTFYAPLLTLRLAVAGNRAHAVTHANQAEQMALVAEANALARENNELLRRMVAGAATTAAARGVDEATVIALARRIAQGEVATVDQALAQLEAHIDTFIAMRERAERGTNEGELVDRTLRAMAARNDRQQFDEGAQDGERAYAELLRQEEEQRAAMRAARLTMARNMVDQHRLRNDPAAMAHWIVEGLHTEHGSLMAADLFQAIKENRDRALRDGLLLELEVALALARIAIDQLGDKARGDSLNWLGIVASDLGERVGGRYLEEAIAAYEDALTVYTQADMRTDWAMTTNNLAVALRTQGERTGGSEGVALLARAVAACQDALTIRTKADMPTDWAMTTNNLAIALRAQGERTGGPEGVALLARAVATYEDALTVHTKVDRRADWAMTTHNLANAFTTQGDRTGGPEGIALLARAVAAFEGALTVYTKSDMRTNWAMTRENMALAHEAIADIDPGLDPLLAAEEALLDALTVYTPEHMSYDFDTATTALTRIRAKIAALKA